MIASPLQGRFSFRKLRFGDGLSSYVNHEFKSTGRACDKAIHIIDKLTGIDDKDPLQVRLSARDKMTGLLLEEIRADRTNPETVNLLGIAAAFSVAAFSTKMFEIDMNLTELAILAASLAILIFIIIRAVNTKRTRKIENVLVLVQAQTHLQRQRLDNTEQACKPRKRRKR